MLKSYRVALLLALAFSPACRPIEPVSAPPGRPNIVLIVTDDQDAGSIAYMPQVTALLADRGTTFADFFVTDPLCCPSRASILRGQYAHNHQVLKNEAPLGGFQRFHDLGHESSTIATWLKAVGYRTAFFGKYLNGYPGEQKTYVPPGWDEWAAVLDWTFYFDYRINENGRIVSYGSRPEDYQTDVLTRKVSDYVQQAAGGRPFFIYLAPVAPHAPSTPAPRHRHQFAGVKVPRPPSFNEADVSDKPGWVRGRGRLNPNEIVWMDRLYRKRLRSLLAVDEMLAGLIGALTRAGTLERTYILFTSDNGYHLGQHRLSHGKGTAYEEDIHVPLIVRGPGVPSGQVLEHFALNIDLAPTIAELAGTPAPTFIDGRSLVTLLGGNPPVRADWRQAFLVESFADPAGTTPGFQALRTREYHYVEYVTGERELYDLRADPHELESLHATADATLLTQLASALAALRRCAGASCRAAEIVPSLRATK